MMTKLSRKFCTMFVILFLLTAANVSQASVPSPSALAGAYEAYYEILKAAVDKQGVIKKMPNSQSFDFDTGKNELIYAELIDFNNDGLPALLYVSSGGAFMWDRECYIYGYSNGEARLYYDEETLGYTVDGPVYVTAYMGMGADNFHGFDIAAGKDGVKYLHVFHHWRAEQDDYYTADKNGKWIKAFVRDYGYDTEGNFTWYVNDVLTNKRSYENAPKTKFGIVETREILEDSDKAFPETVYNVLAQLEKKRR